MSNLITRLEAVNIMLSVIGEAPVNSLDGAKTVDVIQAQSILNEVNRDIQAMGWHFNTEYNVNLAVNEDSEIVLPANILRVDSNSASVDVVQRGLKLYDRTNHTFSFDAALSAEVIFLLDFEEIPQAARQYIMVR